MNAVSAQDLAEILSLSKYWICHKAQKHHWPYVLDSSAGGRPRRLYLIDGLPPDIRHAVRVARGREASERWLRAYHTAASWQIEVAEARADLVRALLNYIKRPGAALQDFLGALRDGVIPGLDADREKAVLAITGVPSERTLRRWRALYEAGGVAALIPQDRGREGLRLTEAHKDYLKALIFHNPDRRLTRLYGYLRDQFPEDCPSYDTVRRFVARWKAAHRETLLFISNPDAWRSQYQAAFGSSSEPATFYNEIWEMDATPADVMCLDGRYKIVGLIDVFSRQPMVAVTKTTAYTAQAALMRRGMLEMGIPAVIRKDNGKEYACRAMNAACEALGIETPALAPFTPEAKPHIERFFNTLTTELFEELPGFIGHNVAQRKAIESRRSFAERFGSEGEVISVQMTAEKLQEAIDGWIARYMTRPHRGLHGKRPVEMIAASPVAPRRVSNPRVLDLLLAPVGERVVQKKGIAYQNGWYQAPELALMVGRRVQLREDLADAGRLYVFADGEYITTAHDAAREGMDLSEMIAARKRQRKAVMAERRALKKLAESVDPYPILQELADFTPTIEPIPREETFTTPMVVEAEKAFAERRAPMGILDELDLAVGSGDEVPLNEGESGSHSRAQPIFDYEFERYDWLMDAAKHRELTDEEIAFMNEFEASELYRKLYGPMDTVVEFSPYLGRR